MTTDRQTAGMTYYRQENGILVYRFQDNRRETVDAWIEQAYQDELAVHAAGGIACLLLDLRGQWVTPYAIVRVIKSANLTPPGLKEWAAVLVDNSFTLSVIQSILHKLPAVTQPTIRFFQSEADALAWLERSSTNLKRKRKKHDSGASLQRRIPDCRTHLLPARGRY